VFVQKQLELPNVAFVTRRPVVLGIFIRDAASLTLWRHHHGLEGAKQHIERCAQTCDHLNLKPAQKMTGVFLDTGR